MFKMSFGWVALVGLLSACSGSYEVGHSDAPGAAGISSTGTSGAPNTANAGAPAASGAPDPGTANYSDNFVTDADGSGGVRLIAPRRLPRDLAATKTAMGDVDIDPNHGENESSRTGPSQRRCAVGARDRRHGIRTEYRRPSTLHLWNP